MFNRRGSLAIEALISLFVYSIFTLLLLGALNVLEHRKSNTWYYFDIGIVQIQELLASCEINEVEEECLYVLCNNEEQEIIFHNERIVRTPGYQIMLSNIQEAMFSIEEEIIYIRGIYANEEFEVAIAKKEWWRW